MTRPTRWVEGFLVPTTPNVVALPDSIKGNSAAQQTCSNGNVR